MLFLASLYVLVIYKGARIYGTKQYHMIIYVQLVNRFEAGLKFCT